MSDLTEFLLKCIEQDEAAYRAEAAGMPWLTVNGLDLFGHLIAQCEAHRAIIAWHEQWPVLTTKPLEVDPVESSDPHRIILQMTQQIEWMTQWQYRARFGEEPPTSPILRRLATAYSGRPGYRDEWRP